MTAEVLREAAALMRERAEAATEGPWNSTVDAQVVAGYGSRFDGEQLADCFQVDPAGDANAYHIASWHPAVALAVADWLDATAAAVAAGSWPPGGALAVARAYLGESS